MDFLPAERSSPYHCHAFKFTTQGKLPTPSDWEHCVPLNLVNTVTGLPPLQSTEVRLGWSEEYLHIRYVCQDPYVVSNFTERDQPLYEQDVVEIFIDEKGDGRSYMELEISPNNVIFDALIQNDDGQGKKLKVDVTWRLEGLQTEVEADDQGNRLYCIHIPSDNFNSPLTSGLCWRVNMYRIDENEQGEREYQAWQPTGAINFHMSSKFGLLQLA
ncbi:carbohydrate-binding family 9-like protein [Paenibacillus illinoisensis]|jgi:hypothetical protein|uniref:Carbohydrate-binding family 9-like protein n=1 Tax=Paenibacillus illinoisensis TaxID=59845 RepID=A0ABW8HXS7_9BACL